MEDLVGKKFGRLLVTEKGPKSKYGGWMYFVSCDCNPGINLEKPIQDREFFRKNPEKRRISCGCARSEKTIIRNKELALPEGVAAGRALYQSRKKDALYKNKKFDISLEFFIEITSSNCYYCNALPSKIYIRKSTNGNYTYNGIDRVDNSLGYIVGNCVPCCWKCNSIKHGTTIHIAEKMLEFVNSEEYRKCQE